MSRRDTRDSRIAKAESNAQGWSNFIYSTGEEISGVVPSENATSVLSLIHISDLHVCDAQSPARVEFMDRFADPHHPYAELVKYVGTYRAQEILTTQTLDALASTINEITTGVVTDRPIDAVVITGDVTDNAQSNELRWYRTILDGGLVTPDSGSLESWDGVASQDPQNYDRSYWNPEGTPVGCEEDFPRSLYGLPTVPGLLEAVRAPFTAEGLRHQWLATHGNHDALLQGTVAADEYVKDFAVGDRRLVGLIPDADLENMFGNFQMVGPTSYPDPTLGEYRETFADDRRRINEPGDWAQLHTECGHDHGLTAENVEQKTKYWSKDIGQVRIISMDTVNGFGGWQGSLDETQFIWLQTILKDPNPKYFVMLSHHPASSLFNDYAPEGSERRVLEKELTDLLLAEPRVILWLAGHNHQHEIQKISNKYGDYFWHIQTASNIDWPQQGRRVEILEDGGKVVIATTVFDHNSPISLDEATQDLGRNSNLAGLSRLLAGNDWQRREGEYAVELMEGRLEDRNRFLWLD